MLLNQYRRRRFQVLDAAHTVNQIFPCAERVSQKFFQEARDEFVHIAHIVALGDRLEDAQAPPALADALLSLPFQSACKRSKIIRAS